MALALGLAPVVALADPPPQWSGDGQEQRSSNGAVLLAWDEELGGGATLEYQLQEASDPEFRDAIVRYHGTYPSWFVSGRLDGTHYFRVRSRPWMTDEDGASTQPWSEWSATRTVVVEHHDLTLSLILLGFGALVFVSTAATLIAGARSTRRAG